MGRLAFPFIAQGKAGVTAEGKREKEREIRLPGVCYLPLHVGPTDPVDCGGSGIVPGSYWHCSLLVVVTRHPCLLSRLSGQNGQMVPLQKPCGGLVVQC